jgi:outer membrane receptor protein involved in Fe transport
MSKRLRLSLLASLLLMVCALPAMAQSTVDGAIGGTITNPNKEVVPGATVVVRNTGTNEEKTATTDDQGRFRIVQLQPGTYAISVNASGFGEFKQERVVVEVGRVTDLDIPLSVGGVTGTVEVTAEAPVINTSQQDFSSNVNQTSINELPINGRRWSNFALLTPGSVADGNFGLISFRGISGLLNNNTIDGGDNNQAFFSEERGRTRISYSISQSAIREFQVNTSNYSAEYGRAAGGVVNAVTKSGTNEFHGDLFYYQRNNKWGARNPLATQSVPNAAGGFDIVGIKPEDIRHQFGGTIGGPIVKDKVFFFFSYDEQKRNFPGLAIFSNPGYLNTANVTTAGATFAASLKNPTRNISDAQINDALNFLRSLSGPVPRRGDQRLILPKIDWRLNDNHTLVASYNRLRWVSPNGIQTQPTNTRGIDNFGDDFVEIDSLNLRLQSAISPTIFNEFRFQYGRDLETQFSQPPIAGEPLTAPGGNRSPQVVLTNGLTFGKPEFLERAAFPDETRWQYADTMTVSRGSHTFKFGVDINYVKDVLDNLRFEGGQFTYNNINDFIIDFTHWRVGLPATVNCSANTARFRGRCYTSNYQQGFGPTASQLSTTEFNFFFQDDWRVSPRLTVNLGMRYEYQRNPDAVTPSLLTTIIPNTNPARTLAEATSTIPEDKNNFGPRFGFAYDVMGDGKTSVRGGYGIYYGRTQNSTISNALVNTGAAGGQAQVSIAPTVATSPIFPNTLTAGAAGAGAIQFFSPNYQSPLIHQADLIVEREIAQNTVVSASLLISLGRSLPTFVDLNVVPVFNADGTRNVRTITVNGGPAGGEVFQVGQYARALPALAQLTEIRSTVKSQYWGFVLQANRRLTKGLQFQTSYTLSEARDTGQTSTTFTSNNVPLDPFDQSFDKGLSNFHVRHKFVTSVVYSPARLFGLGGDDGMGRAIFGGWTIAPVVSAYSGRPFSEFISGSSLNNSFGASRLQLLPRNSFSEPSIVNVDLRISRRFRFSETMNLEVLAEAFNLFNRTQVTQVQNTLYNTAGFNTAPTTALVGTLNFNAPFNSVTAAGGTLFRERQVQLAVRFQF